MKQLLLAITLLLTITTISNAYAGVPRLNYDEAYADIAGAPECWGGWV